jgi:hypothetical protein
MGSYTPSTVARAHALRDLAQHAHSLAAARREAIPAAASDQDREYLAAYIDTAEGVAKRLRASPGFEA